jgi:hypothetical protein
MYKERNEKLKMGPLWDFDISAGNIDFNGNDNPEGWWIRQTGWIDRLLKDPAFRNKIDDFWRNQRDHLKSTIDLIIDANASRLGKSQEVNFMKWRILDSFVWPNAVVTGSYNKEILYLKSWIGKRIAWIDTQISPLAPNPYNVLSPSDERVIRIDNKSAPLPFTWERSPIASVYTLFMEQVGSGELPKTWQVSRTGADSSLVLSTMDILELFNHMNVGRGDSLKLRWSVKAQDTWTQWQSHQSFSLTLVNQYLHAPIITAPAEGSVTSSSRVTLQWLNSVENVGSYVQLSSSPDFDSASLLISEQTEGSDFKISMSLTSPTPYYWRVKTVSEGDSSNWTVSTFSVAAKPDLTVTLKDEDAVAALLEWTYHEAHSYVVEISFTEDFSEGVIRIEGWNQAEYLMQELQAGSTYFVRVKAVLMDAESEWSEMRAFTVGTITGLEYNFRNGASVYPNPSRDNFSIHVPDGTDFDGVSVMDTRGVILISMEPADDQSTITIDGTGLKPGVYIVVVRKAGQVLGQMKLVKQ